MGHIKYAAFVIFFSFMFFSCDPCKNLDCLSDNYNGQFRIVRATDGEDLVFGPNSIYEKSQITFYSLKNTDTTFFDYQTIKFPNMGYDSILRVHFFPKTDIAYMRLSNGDIDTLEISHKTLDTKCCGTITEITNFKFNKSVDIPGGMGTQEIRK
ncbi:hypothetical protein [Flavihumibacter fluvii]|uniref:hypothetical protein n=1 Tax=Flavihumibacter fluvii TaxID=2838157 RepID=UPI001BDE8612|nr:hypothetical protein [Flavihumibacter fluvii]ULQ53383.1 hypothetical protein KJS93_03505 [Flavihumibacter fluvii]